MSFAQPPSIRTISAAASGVPSPKFVGSTLLRSRSMCCSTMQLSVNFIRTSAGAMGRSLRGHGCGNCCPGSGFFGPQSSGAMVAAVQSFAVWCGTTACVHVPIHSRNTPGPPLRASNGVRCLRSSSCWARLRCQHNTLAMRFTSFAGWKREFRSSLLDRCTLHLDPRNILFVCVNSNKRVDLSGSLYVWRCACVSGESVKPRGCSVSVSVCLTRRSPGVVRSRTEGEKPTGHLILHSSQGLMPCGREDRRSSISGQCKTRELSPLLW